MEAALGLAGVIITGLMTIVGVLLKVLLSRITETQEAMQPLSNGFASKTHSKLDHLTNRQDEVCREVKRQGNDIRNLQAADDTLLELIADVRSHQT